MAATIVRNRTANPLPLPFPLIGVLAGGAGIVVGYAKADIEAIYGGASQVVSAFEFIDVTDITGITPNDSALPAAALEAAFALARTQQSSLGFGGLRLRDVAAPSSANDVARKADVDAVGTTATAALPKAGGTMTGNIVMGGHKITGLGAPTGGSTDAATALYAEGVAAAAQAAAIVAAAADATTKANAAAAASLPLHGNADTATQAAKLAATGFFHSTQQTGTGAPQNIAHTLGSVPAAVWVSVEDTTDAGIVAAGYAVAQGAHDGANIVITATANLKFRVTALK